MNKYLLILLMLSCANAFADLNKWVDENGKVQYSDQPPPANVKAKKLRSAIPSGTSSTAAASAPAATKTLAEREAEWKKAQQAKKEAADKSAQEQAQQAEKKANCSAAQQNLTALQTAAPITEYNAMGERTYLDDSQRQQRIAKARQDVDDWCK